MLIKELELKDREINGSRIWYFIDKDGNEKTLLLAKPNFTRAHYINFKNRGVIISNKMYDKFINRRRIPMVELSIVSPIVSDIDKFICGAAIVTMDGKLKLAIQYKPYHNIETQDSFEASLQLINDLGIFA